jgi:YegS/Rv2252/BmrU family lipid kinase
MLVVNPNAGSYAPNAHHIATTCDFLQQHGWQATIQFTQCAGDAARFTREAIAQQIDIVIAVGGDGTIHEIIQELAGSQTALGVLPCGTVNVWVREAGIPLDLQKARELLVQGQRRQIDLGKINDHYFLLMVGIGLDGEITQKVERKGLKRLGIVGYMLAAIWFGLHYSAFRTKLRFRKHTIKMNALQIVIGNTQLYAGALKYTWRARCDDGLLDVCVVRKQSRLGRIFIAIDFMLGRKQRQQWVHYEVEDSIQLLTRTPIAIQVDGEPMGYTAGNGAPTIICVVPHALHVIVPHNLPKELFSQA